MGEQPLFSCKAHVFQLEPELKKSWIGLSSTAVNVQIFHDPIKNIYRIVSVEGIKALINSIVTPRMTFTKTSQKFGQWIDFKLNLVYGLGFANDVELNKFVEKFKEIKELTRSNIVLKPHERSNSCEITSINRNQNAENSLQNDASHEANLKYENDRLKFALAQSTANSRKWDEEIQTLKSNTLRLTTALQETNANAEDLKKQLQYYKDECTRLRNNHNIKADADDDEVSSTSNGTFNGKTQTGKTKLKQELLRLTESFDKKCAELNAIRDQMRKLVNELN